MGKNIPGNSNAGHEGHGAAEDEGFTQTLENGVWRDFTDEERYALVEYMKSLSSRPAVAVVSGEANSATTAVVAVNTNSNLGTKASKFELVPDVVEFDRPLSYRRQHQRNPIGSISFFDVLGRSRTFRRDN